MDDADGQDGQDGQDARPVMLTVAEAAARAGLSSDVLRKRCLRGKVPGAQKFDGTWLVPSDIADGLAGQTTRGIVSDRRTDGQSELSALVASLDRLAEALERDRQSREALLVEMATERAALMEALAEAMKPTPAAPPQPAAAVRPVRPPVPWWHWRHWVPA